MNRRTLLIALPLFLVAGLVGYRLSEDLDQDAKKSPRVPAAGVERLLATTLPDSTGKATSVKAWRGQVLVVNFWATWCPPCRKEMPAFSRVNTKYTAKGVQFVGIGLDSPSAIKEYILQTPIGYPVLVSGIEGFDLLRELGNEHASVPYTVVLDRQGKPAFSRLGIVEEAELEALLDRLSSS